MPTHDPSLFMRYQDLAARAAASPHYADEAWLARYARQHRAAILASRGDILQEYVALQTDTLFLALLRACAPQLILWSAWRVNALKIAEELDVEQASADRPRLTPEEWQARIERYRQRSLTRKRVKFEDHRADVLQDLEMLQDFITDLDRYPSLDEDERERLIQEFKERLLGGEEEAGNGFKQL